VATSLWHNMFRHNCRAQQTVVPRRLCATQLAVKLREAFLGAGELARQVCGPRGRPDEPPHEADMAERCHRRCILGRGELAQVVDAEAFFDIGDFIDHPLKAGLAEPPVLLVFEGLS
jgi:hypothetical protein